MSPRRPLAIILYKIAPYLECELAKRFEIVRLADLSPAEAKRWLGEHGRDVIAVITNGIVGCSGKLIDALPALEIIAIHGVGYDTVDLAAARGRGIIVTNTPGVLTNDVADLAVGLIIALLRAIPAADRHIRQGDWNSAEFRLTTSVSGKRFGIVGLGRIGWAIADRLTSFGDILYTGNSAKDVPWVFRPDVVSLARDCDVLIVACAASERTRSMINRDVLNALGKQGYLINIARGSVVDENALIEAISSGGIAGAALDVFADEPNVAEQLRNSERVVLTPHVASATTEGRKAMADRVLANLDEYLAQNPVPDPVL